jgi:tRNA1Val (adenine37-N6)-methyltransferase
MKFVHPYIDKEANMVLIEAVYGAKSMVKLEPPIIVFQEEGVYSEEIREIYGY